tara:strand:+ start:349 stop:639 length:291 start_codon:yes stop_codon:yes gene_type:complete
MGYEELKKEIREKRLGINVKPESLDKDFSDEYNIDEKWQRIKRLIEKTEPRLYKFMFKGTVDASIDARNNLNELRKLMIELRGSVLSQRQDNESEY